MSSRDNWCCLYPACPVTDCPEPLCAREFPGGIEAFLRHKQTMAALEVATDIEQAASMLNISESAAQRRFKRVKTR